MSKKTVGETNGTNNRADSDNIVATDRDSSSGVEQFAPTEVGEVDLYQKRERIYTRRVEGFFQRIRLLTGWPLLIGYFALPWFEWGERQAILFDLPARQFHLLGITLWPQDMPFLAWLLVIAAFALFTVTVFAGRVWCGYTCPQTIWTSVFMWAEQVSEGTRNQRMRLDRAPWSLQKLWKKTVKHSLWMGFSLLTGVTFVGYFVPIRELIPSMLLLDAGFWAWAWAIFFTLATYINAGWMREQLCMYVCPYARFQSVMFDADTLIVSYDERRGEARGSRKAGVDPRTVGKGDCIDCKICVQVCPTGIDIRDGLQYECITCALCIDACDAVMDRMNYPRGLIRYTTENRVTGKGGKIVRPKLIGYTVATALISLLFTYNLLTRVPLELDSIRQRGDLYHAVNNTTVANTFMLRVLNKSQSSGSYQIVVEGLDNAQVIGVEPLQLGPGEISEVSLRIHMQLDDLHSPSQAFTFRVVSDTQDHQAVSESRFLSPAG